MPKRAFALAMLNYTLDDDFIIPFLDGLCRSGYEGICLHPRDGLLVPYGSRFYWERVDRIIGLARERGMEVWHYDEFPFPSGSAGGRIPERHPFTHVQSLQFVEIENAPNAQGAIDIGRGSLLALLRYREDENGAPRDWQDVTADTGSLIDTWSWGEWHNRFYTGTSRVREELHERGSAEKFHLVYQPLEPLGDDKLLAIKIARLPGKKKEAGHPDITLPEVTDLFLEEIYGAFAELSRKHGLAATPVFQDEVTFYSPFPWNREIEERLRPVWGEEMPSKLASLWKPGSPGWELARYEYRAACQDAFEQNWCVRVAEFCRAHGMRMSGHLPGEESIFMHSQLTGDIFRALKHFDIPGYDIISSHLSDDENRSHAAGVKIVQSSAWLEGRKPAMVEVFGAHGFHNDLQKNRATLSWMTAHDITLTFDHSAYGSALGVRKYDAPPIHNRFNPLDVGRPDLWNWNNWFADLLEEYSFDPETLVLFPADAMARFHASELEEWREETALLETWFHYACAHSLDCIFVPSYLLNEIEPLENGFKLRGQIFKNFLVPPVSSLHETSWNALEKLSDQPGFVWSLPKDDSEITVFGAQLPDGEKRTVKAHRTKNCTEEQLVEEKSDWFDEIVSSRVAAVKSSRTLLKSLRRHRENDSRLLVLINPTDEPLEVRSTLEAGEAIAQPPNGIDYGFHEENGEQIITLAPRDTAIFRIGENTQQESTLDAEKTAIEPRAMEYRFAAPNRQSLKIGTAKLEGYEPIDFRPTRISSLWLLPIRYEDDVAVYVEPHSLAPLPEPLAFEFEFPVVLSEALSELRVLLDTISMPPGTQLFWDDTLLSSQIEAVIDVHNTTFSIPAEFLTKGEHTLRFRGTAESGGEGLIERPILIGDFLVDADEPLALRAMPQEWQTLSTIRSWPQLGMPEGYGPVEYRMSFDVPAEQVGESWTLQLPQCIGVAEVEVNSQPIGRSSWEPRRLRVPEGVLRAGENQVKITLHGSWNNVFSALNRLENGLTGEPTLVN